jgi:MFS family permease
VIISPCHPGAIRANLPLKPCRNDEPMRLLISFAALFLAVVLLQLGSGGVAPLDAISGASLGFSTEQLGLLGSAHFFGFFIGCWWAPRLMGSVGHSRAFAAFTAAGTIGILAHMLIVDPLAWSVMRMASGLCVAGCYTIIEAWLQDKVTNATRARAMGVYRVVDIAGSLGAQLMIGVLEPASYVSYNLLALLCCCAIFPLTLTRSEAPPTPLAPRLRPGLAWRKSPLASMGVVVSGVTGAAFRMVGPVYGLEVGLGADLIALFLAAYVLGGAVAQIPVGWLADRYDRRSVLIWISVAGIFACGATIALAASGISGVFAAAALFGFATLPVYSISTAHAHDYAEPQERVELSAALMFLYAVGAIASPYVASLVIEHFGPEAMFVMIGIAHAGLIVFGFARMRVRPSQTRTAYTYEPRTSFLIGRLLRRDRTGE